VEETRSTGEPGERYGGFFFSFLNFEANISVAAKRAQANAKKLAEEAALAGAVGKSSNLVSIFL
jgi:hypothetical protein